MSKGKSNISEEDFRRYLENKMTENERNAFEKELQKDPFAAEALEGFETVSLADIKNDLNEIEEKLHPIKRKNRYRYFAAAATILLIITAGVIWIQFNNENPLPEVVETSELESDKTDDRRPMAKALSQKTEEKETQGDIKNTDQAEQEIHNEEISDLRDEVLVEMDMDELDDEVHIQAVENEQNLQSETLSKPLTTNVQRTEASRQQADIKKVKTAPLETYSNILDIGGVKNELKAGKALSEDKLVRGIIISAGDSMPLPGVTLVEKGTQNATVTDIDGSFQLQLLNQGNGTIVASFVGMKTVELNPDKDSVNLIELEAEHLALEEVVTVAYGAQRKRSVTGSVTEVSDKPADSKAKPVCGMKEYNNYLKENTILSNNQIPAKVVVKLLIKLDNKGNIVSIKNANKADEVFFEKAKNLIINGPEWSPELKNGENIESEVRLKIVFKKKSDN